MEAARNGFKAHGIELNVWLVLYSKWRAFRSNLTPRATFAKQDLWKSDLSKYDNVVIFGVEEMVNIFKYDQRGKFANIWIGGDGKCVRYDGPKFFCNYLQISFSSF